MLTNTYECLAIILRSLLLVANCIRKPIRLIFATFWRICREYLFLHSQGYSPQCESSIKKILTNASRYDPLVSEISARLSDISALVSEISALVLDNSVLGLEISALVSEISALVSKISARLSDISALVSESSSLV